MAKDKCTQNLPTDRPTDLLTSAHSAMGQTVATRTCAAVATRGVQAVMGAGRRGSLTLVDICTHSASTV